MGAESNRSALPEAVQSSVSSAPSESGDFKCSLLDEDEKQHVILTWKQVERNIAKVGVITFLGLFETHPAVQSVFLPLSQLSREELGTSAKLEAHALKVMNFIQKVIARIDNPPKVHALLCQLGKSHCYYGAKKEYIDLVGPQFVNAIRPLLENIWTPVIQDSWLHLFASMSAIMKTAMAEVETQLPVDKRDS